MCISPTTLAIATRDSWPGTTDLRACLAQRLMPNIRRAVATVIAVAGLMAVIPVVSPGSPIVFYTSRPSFNTAEPGLPIEGFSNADITAGSIELQASPLSGATNDSIFSTGSVLSGLSVSASSGLIVYGDGAITGGTKSVATNSFGDTLVLTFAGGVSAVGTDVFAASSPGQTLAGNITETVYHGSTVIGSKTVSEVKGAFGFIGVSSAASAITSVTLLYTTDDASTFADNIAFGSQTSSVPEPSTLALSALAAVLFAIASSRVNRQVSQVRNS
jgi:hypothetical protein